MLHKTEPQLALLLDPMEWVTNAHSCREWLEEIQSNPQFGEELKVEGIHAVQVLNQGPHPVIVISFFDRDLATKWVQSRMIKVLSLEEYHSLCAECGVQPQPVIQFA